MEIKGKFVVRNKRFCADRKKFVLSTETVGYRTLYMHVVFENNIPVLKFTGFRSYSIESIKRINTDCKYNEFCIYRGKIDGMASIFVNKKEVFDFIDMELEKLNL